jgi:adenine-specific DNA-methyltransferase
MPVDSFKHKKDKRPLIPSIEEEGQEKSNIVSEPKVRDYPINPVVNRGQDPELFWLNKYGSMDEFEKLSVDIRSLYRSEHISPEIIMKNLYRYKRVESNQLSLTELFGNVMEMEELDKVSEYYKHQEGWSNRLILGDSQLVMNSLLEREGFAGKVQMIYIDPPYGIKYGSNWQMKLNNMDVKDGKDEHLTGEPEQIKAYRDTWELGVHSYLSYLRDRLLIAKELLTESGSLFVQISDENVHLVRNILDEIFGSENFMSQINLKRASVMFTKKYLKNNIYYLLWYSKNVELVKYRQLYRHQDIQEFVDSAGSHLWMEDITTKKENRILPKFRKNIKEYLNQNKELTVFSTLGLNAQGTEKQKPFSYQGQKFYPPPGTQWKSSYDGLATLAKINRLIIEGNKLRYKYYYKDYPVSEIGNYWDSIGAAGDKLYVVQTNDEIVKRCILMTTDPGDLLLDPTCGAGTTAYAAEQWGRRWITIDTSRIALNIAKTRLMTSVYPYYKLYDEEGLDIRQGFHYKKVPHITLKSLANDEPAEDETLFDQPLEDKKKLRVAGPFTVETLQSLNPVTPEELEIYKGEDDTFEERIFEHLRSAGIKTGVKEEKAVFTRIDRLGSLYLHAEGFYNTKEGEKKAFIHIGPKFGTVSKISVNEAIKECRQKGDADWLIILGFSFESEIQGQTITKSVGTFRVSKARMHDDLMQDGLLKKDKKAGSFITIAEPDIKVHEKKKSLEVEIRGLDIYDPISDEVKPRDIHDIAYWMIDDDYDGSNFIVKQIFFCGGDKHEFTKWQKGLENLARTGTKRSAEKTLKIEIDEEAFDRLYGHKSHPIEITKKNQKIAVKVISQFGEESMKVLDV